MRYRTLTISTVGHAAKSRTAIEQPARRVVNDSSLVRTFANDEQVKINGEKVGEFDSHPGSVTSYFDVIAYDVHTVTLESLGLDTDEWISLLEVSKNGGIVGVSRFPSRYNLPLSVPRVVRAWCGEFGNPSYKLLRYRHMNKTMSFVVPWCLGSDRSIHQ